MFSTRKDKNTEFPLDSENLNPDPPPIRDMDRPSLRYCVLESPTTVHGAPAISGLYSPNHTVDCSALNALLDPTSFSPYHTGLWVASSPFVRQTETIAKISVMSVGNLR